MFSGLIEELGSVARITVTAAGASLVVRAARVMEGSVVGDSIAVNGVCLTVEQLTKEGFQASVMAETLRSTSMGSLKVGDPLNLERALALGQRLGGHLVSGHVDAVGRVRRRSSEGLAEVMELEAPPQVLRYTVPKGSIAVDGVSLTVVKVLADAFTISLIPHTAGVTTLGRRQPGSLVNLEADVIARYLERLLGERTEGLKPTEGLDQEFLAKHGFA